MCFSSSACAVLAIRQHMVEDQRVKIFCIESFNFDVLVAGNKAAGSYCFAGEVITQITFQTGVVKKGG